MLTRNTHETHLRRLLSLIFTNRKLSNSLAFKGGTCLYMFYNLDRFSTDLDFNLVDDNFLPENMNEVLTDYIIQDYFEKYNTWFWLLSYEKTQMKIKIEISKRNFPDNYEVKELLGIPLKVMTADCMFAHKLCAITDRKKLQNRDLYDTYFMLKKSFEINENIVQLRTGKSLKDYLILLVNFIKLNLKEKHSLDGLGEVLDEKQKIWVRENLKQLLLLELQNKILELENIPALLI